MSNECVSVQRINIENPLQYILEAKNRTGNRRIQLSVGPLERPIGNRRFPSRNDRFGAEFFSTKAKCSVWELGVDPNSSGHFTQTAAVRGLSENFCFAQTRIFAFLPLDGPKCSQYVLLSRAALYRQLSFFLAAVCPIGGTWTLLCRKSFSFIMACLSSPHICTAY
ncbi:LAME_0G00628g1_1 [Lachancea meyersii CBS 8951]|uniref:LAME_0G00628g1_1 n=1 Tax=Lachancea meyersii CBS 8951 TaxID=1266667 RepID=A0A1G4K4V3_9SACH|nr:LAME_0G00628g1_1 [Lachancea meyersii CBS 8951]